MPDFQSKYGIGGKVLMIISKTQLGPRFDGQPRQIGPVFLVELFKQNLAPINNLKDFLQYRNYNITHFSGW
jgi:hypothetical protein